MAELLGASDGLTASAPSYVEKLVEDVQDELNPPPESKVSTAGLPDDRFIDRELSWLEFNARILEVAEAPSTPLLERARFLAIFANNLDEFFMVRVASLKRRIATGMSGPIPSGLSPRGQLAAVLARTRELMERHVHAFGEQVLPALSAEGIEIVRWGDLGESDRAVARQFFHERVFPVLTPLAVDPAHPFPYISGLSLNIAVVVRDEDGREHFARVKVPSNLPRLLPLGADRFVPLEQIIVAHLPRLFSGLEVVQASTFRVTRNQDLEVENDDDESVLKALERELQRRRFGPPVRLEVESGTSRRVLDLLLAELRVNEDEVYRLAPPLDLTALFTVADVDRPELDRPAFRPRTHPLLREREDGEPPNFFSLLNETDVLVHHPYQSFTTSVQAFLEQAANDPRVLAIKQTLYRTSGDSPIVDALIDAAESGKQVLVCVEIKARFDEQANIRWARALERAGAHVVYGVVGLKTHGKLCLVVRQDEDGVLRRYSHVGTGNYNSQTARLYEDLGLLTSAPDVGADLSDLFNHLSGHTRHLGYRTLLVAPESLRSGLVEMIAREARHAEAGRPAGITIKCNAVVDEEIIDALYQASRAGVPIELVVRGMCALRPGVPGLSETIRVRSIIGQFLEHSRLFRFENGGDVEYWMGSADIMHRNLDRRVEVVIHITHPKVTKRLEELLTFATSDEIVAWDLAPDGVWTRRKGDELVDYQERLISVLAMATATVS
ncbi:MAG: RNA degradosome polyphosphate kinase [Streptosporangiales bacterium]|nr:RNA degradosome polyphosphate kinase [Streptosporangiales bacterium]MBO0889456.1 RNA degradosome polyphosphate kinase [Acidothermales bacterium]